MIVNESNTGFVEAGTALANLATRSKSKDVYRPILSVRRNIFIADNLDVLEDNTEPSLDSGAGFLNSRNLATMRGTENSLFGTQHIKHHVVQPKPAIMVTHEITVPLSIFEGTVEDVDTDKKEFTAIIHSKLQDIDPHRVTIPLDEIEPADLELLSQGAIFYIEQYQRNRRGGREHTQILRFRRSFNWTKKAIDWVKAEASMLDAVLPPYVPVKDDD